MDGEEKWVNAIGELLEACDTAIPEPERDVDKPFLMCIEDVFSIEGRGTVVTGRVERGIINKMDEVEIVGLRDVQKTTATDLEMFRKLLSEARAGENVGVCCAASRRRKSSVARCWPSRAPSSRIPSSRGKLCVKQGGRWPSHAILHQLPSSVYFRTTDVTGSLTLPEGTEMVMPGDNVTVSVELGKPVAMEAGLTFAIREGGRTIGSGQVTEVIE